MDMSEKDHRTCRETLEEANEVYSLLTPGEKDEWLQSILIAFARDRAHVAETIEELLFVMKCERDIRLLAERKGMQ